MQKKLFSRIMGGAAIMLSGLLAATQSFAADWAHTPMEKTTKVVLNIESGGPANTLRRFAPEIKEKLNIDLEVVTVPFFDKYGIQYLDLTSGTNQYDIYGGWPTYTADFAPYIEPLKNIAPGGEEQVKKDLQWNQVHDSYKWVHMYNQEIYGTQIDGDVKLLHYRYDLANDPQEKATFKAKYGYELDMHDLTWERYLDVAEFFTRPDQDFYGTSEVATFFVYFFFKDRFDAMGGHLFDYNTMEAFPDKELAIKALKHGQDTFLKYAPPGASGFDFGTALNQLWVDGRVFMLPMWPDGWRQANDPKLSKFVGKIGVAPMPGFEKNGKTVFRPNMAGGRVLVIGKRSNVKEAAYKVLTFFSDTQRTTGLVNDTLSWLDAWRTPHFNSKIYGGLCEGKQHLCDEYAQVMDNSTRNGYPELQLPGTGEYHDIIERWSGKAFQNLVTPEKAYASMVKEMNRVTRKRGKASQLEAWQSYVDGVLKPLNLYP